VGVLGCIDDGAGILLAKIEASKRVNSTFFDAFFCLTIYFSAICRTKWSHTLAVIQRFINISISIHVTGLHFGFFITITPFTARV